jgi:hypothetical protein
MSFFNVTRNTILCVVVLMAVPLFTSARSKPENTKVEKKTIQVDKNLTVDGKTLIPGKYEVIIDSKKVSFERDGQMVATAPCDWKVLSFKSQFDSVTVSSNNVLQEIDFEGSNRALEVL